MSVTTKITFNDSPSGQGDAPQVTGRISNMVITNNTGESIAYSTDSGASFTTLANGSSATLGAGDPSSFRFRRVNSGGYPLAVDAVITMSTPMSDGWFDTNADGSTSPVAPLGGFLRGALSADEWFTVPSIFRLRLTGTGTVTIDSKDALGSITTGIASYTVTDATNQIEFPYAGDAAVMIRATLTGSATAEVI